jgi:hypothetical protein
MVRRVTTKRNHKIAYDCIRTLGVLSKMQKCMISAGFAVKLVGDGTAGREIRTTGDLVGSMRRHC